jgi:hypothetical protein
MQGDNNNPAWIEGIEVFKPYVDYARHHGSINKVNELNLEEMYKLPYPDKSFDIVICTEALEHLSRETALIVLLDTQRVAKEKIFISTPAFWMAHFEVDGNPFQLHKSKWKFKDFENLGFKVKGIGSGFNFMTNRFGLKQKFGIFFFWLGFVWKSQANTWLVMKDFGVTHQPVNLPRAKPMGFEKHKSRQTINMY